MCPTHPALQELKTHGLTGIITETEGVRCGPRLAHTSTGREDFPHTLGEKGEPRAGGKGWQAGAQCVTAVHGEMASRGQNGEHVVVLLGALFPLLFTRAALWSCVPLEPVALRSTA